MANLLCTPSPPRAFCCIKETSYLQIFPILSCGAFMTKRIRKTKGTVDEHEEIKDRGPGRSLIGLCLILPFYLYFYISSLVDRSLFPKHLLQHLIPLPPPHRPLRIRRDDNPHRALQRAAKHAHPTAQELCVIAAIIIALVPFLHLLPITITIITDTPIMSLSI